MSDAPRVVPPDGLYRPTIKQRHVNQSADAVRQALPSFGPARGLLSICFIDPFDLRLRFQTMRQLAHLRMDFLVLLMLGVDGRRNFHRYFADPTSARIGDLIDCHDWRDKFRPNDRVLHFLLSKFDEAMQTDRLFVRCGGLSAREDRRHGCAAVCSRVLQQELGA
jgi:hypothetical protein